MLTSLIIDNWYVGIPLVIGLMLLDWLLTQVGYKNYLRYVERHKGTERAREAQSMVEFCRRQLENEEE